jgi:hypothetical protein
VGENSSLKSYKITHEFTCEEFKKFFEKEEETFPIDDFSVITKNHNHIDIVEYLVSKGFHRNAVMIGNADNYYYNVIKNSRTIEYNSYNRGSKTYTLNQLKQLDKQMEMYSIKDLETRNDLVIYIDNREEYDKLSKLTTKLVAWYHKRCYSLFNKTYCHLSTKEDAGWYKENWNSKIITINQIKELNNMENKKIIGYKLIKPEYKEAALAIVKRLSDDSWENWDSTLKKYGVNFYCPSNHEKWLKEAKVLDIWFTPVFEPEKPKEVIVELSNGKSVTVKKEYVLAEAKKIDIKYIKSLHCNTNTFGDTGWSIQYNTFDIGCYKNLTRNDLNLIIEAYNKLQ